ncbi:probable trehalose-phosphate phosphatase 4 [Dendroctonus ponderosae]|uniref:Trehalose 6-phosphate phosphatase n=1 Tax=Dendroctonus ponderosae TaxID=77166 RepID=A0AAR5PL47_DENPD|nr:probable trehalose-phosphate phosphatase 4 [Dendroctonus ponderosae]
MESCGNRRSFDDFEDHLTQYLKDAKQIALLLDYDGTLSPIVAHPDLATIPLETKALLEDLSAVPNIFLAIISGRNTDNVKQMVGIDNIVYAGNHGLEVIYPDGTKYVHQLPTEFSNQVKQLIANLEQSVVRDGAWIENKGASLTFHFRATPEEKRTEIENTARQIIEKAGFKVGNAHMALEARPKVEWNKGSVALLILDRHFGANKWKGNVKVIFAGDDTTDEDAMLALKGNAATFRIAPTVDVKTHAEKLLSSTQAVVTVLKLVKKLAKK